MSENLHFRRKTQVERHQLPFLYVGFQGREGSQVYRVVLQTGATPGSCGISSTLGTTQHIHLKTLMYAQPQTLKENSIIPSHFPILF